MTGNAQWTTLGAIADATGGLIQTGPFGSDLHAEDYLSDGTPVVMPADLGHNLISDANIARIGPADVQRLSQFILRKGDIVLPRRGDVSRFAYVDEKYDGWLTGTGCLRVRLGRDNKLVDPRYIAYVFGSQVTSDWLLANAVGTTLPNLNTGILRALPVYLPPLAEQREIAGILGALDDKIALNRQMNATLEGMARALFQSWFVDFDPVRAKAEGRAPDGMDAETAALFPASFEDSPLGPIPSGWDVKPLDQIADFLNGLALQKFPPDSEESLPVVKIRELRQGYADASSDRASVNIKPAYVISNGDVIFSWSGSLMMDVWCGGPGALNQHLFKVTSSQYPKWFHFHWTQRHLDNFVAIAANKATTMGHIQRHHLSEALVVVPPIGLLNKLSEHMEPLLGAVVANRLQSRTLAETRDALLPKLVSGELRVLKICG